MKTSCCQSKSYLKEEETILCTNKNCETYLRSTTLFNSRTWNNTFVLFFFIFFFVFSFDDFSFSGSHTKKMIRSNHYEIEPQKELSKATLKEELDVNKIICPEQVYAQILIESAHLESYLTKRTNNLLGMRYPFRRQTTAIGIFLPESNLIIKGTQAELKKYRNENHYAVFANWQECIRDYKFWQDECFKLTDKYLTFLGKYYAEDTRYVEKIKSLSE
ncbi:MAG: glucosaminidase domain-containing protein [Bacteroidia bacterium]|nr:glucosaminidase domain-containing protein [Bacteroidia bacterium]